MKTVTIALLLNLILLTPSVWSRELSTSERTQIKAQLDAILKNNQDECYVNASNFNNIDVLSLAEKKQKTFIEKSTRNLYLRGNLSSTLNLDAADSMLPEGTIDTDNAGNIMVNYRRAVTLTPVEISYSEIETQNIAEGLVTHVFETQNGQPVWKYSMVDIFDGQNKKPHVRCRAKGDEGFLKGKSVIKPVQPNAFRILDLEFIIPEYCLTQCSDLTVMPIRYHTF